MLGSMKWAWSGIRHMTSSAYDMNASVQRKRELRRVQTFLFASSRSQKIETVGG